MKAYRKIIGVAAVAICLIIVVVTFIKVKGINSSDKLVLQLAHNQSAGSEIADSIAKVSDYVAQESGDEVNIKIFASGVLGTEKEEIEMVKAGIIDMAKVSSNTLGQFDDRYAIFAIPYLFKNQEHYYNAMEKSEAVKELFNDTADEEAIVESKKLEQLTDEQKSIFSYFIPVKGMEDQLCRAYNGVMEHFAKKETAKTGNLIIQGAPGCGKTVLATSFIKVLQKGGEQPAGKIGKIDASALNKKDVQQLVRKVAGGCLIIERAGDINKSTAQSLSYIMEHDITGTLYILEDTSKGIKKALAADAEFAEKFTERISVPIFTNDELVSFALSYSSELGYKIDEMAILALHNRISNIERLDQATTLTEVKEIVDEAIDREAHGGLKKAISILTAKRYTEDDKIVLTENYFEQK